MKLFESARKNFEVVGYNLHYSNQKYHLNARNMTMLFLMAINTLANGAYVVCRTESFAEYLQDIYVTSSVATALVFFIIEVIMMPELFTFIENLEQIVNKSMYTVL